jgi:hypothetical protein
MHYTIVQHFPHPTLMEKHVPSVSIYLPTHRLLEDQDADRILFEQLLKEAFTGLDNLPMTPGTKDIKQSLLDFKSDHVLWQHALDGLAIFASEQMMILYQTQTPFQPLCVVADSFHLKPLYAYFQNVESFYFLALEADRFMLYEGNLHGINPVVMPMDSKLTLTDVLGSQLIDNYQTIGSYGGTFVGSTYHGHGGKKDAIAIDREKFFRYVDRFVYDQFSKHHPIPLILITPKDHQALFRSVAKNPHIVNTMIDGSFETIIGTHLLGDLKVLTDARFSKHLQRMILHYQAQRHLNLSSDNLDVIAKALMDGRVSTLMIEIDHIIPGQLNMQKQNMTPWRIEEPHTDDVLDDMLQLALTKGTNVYMIEKSMMPTTQGIAANFRY